MSTSKLENNAVDVKDKIAGSDDGVVDVEASPVRNEGILPASPAKLRQYNWAFAATTFAVSNFM